jgi:hypothetical protein
MRKINKSSEWKTVLQIIFAVLTINPNPHRGGQYSPP